MAGRCSRWSWGAIRILGMLMMLRGMSILMQLLIRRRLRPLGTVISSIGEPVTFKMTSKCTTTLPKSPMPSSSTQVWKMWSGSGLGTRWARPSNLLCGIRRSRRRWLLRGLWVISKAMKPLNQRGSMALAWDSILSVPWETLIWRRGLVTITLWRRAMMATVLLRRLIIIALKMVALWNRFWNVGQRMSWLRKHLIFEASRQRAGLRVSYRRSPNLVTATVISKKELLTWISLIRKPFLLKTS